MWIVTKVIRMNVQIPSSIEITESQAKWGELLGEKKKQNKTEKELPSILAFPKASEEENNLRTTG